MPTVRRELPSDIPAINDVLTAAFPTQEEKELVKSLRHNGHLTISLVAEEDGVIVGCIAFSPVTTNGKPGGLGLAPVAVVPEHQSMGVGANLVRAGIAAAKEQGAGYVVVLGHSHYYPQFGFRTAKTLGFDNEFKAEESFMILDLKQGKFPSGGMVKYGSEFSVLS